MTCNAKVAGGDVTFELETGHDIEEAVELYGEKPVFSLYRQKLVISARGVFVAAYEKAVAEGADHDDAVEAALKKVADWKPGQASPRSSKEDKAFAELINLDDDAIARLEDKKGLPKGSMLQIRDQLRKASNWKEDED
jgi:hypothetical protein